MADTAVHLQSELFLERGCSVRIEVVPKGLLTFFGSLYKEGAKFTSGTLVETNR